MLDPGSTANKLRWNVEPLGSLLQDLVVYTKKKNMELPFTTENLIQVSSYLATVSLTSPRESNLNHSACRDGGSIHKIEKKTADAAICEMYLGLPNYNIKRD